MKLPSGWRLARIAELRANESGTLVGGPFGSELTRADYVSEPGVPVIRGSNLGGKESRFIDSEFVYVSEAKAASLERNLAYPGDIVFTQRGTLGQAAIIPHDARFPKYVISQSQMKLTADRSRVDPRFLYYFFRSPSGQRRLLARTQATGVPHINLAILKECQVPLPPLRDQTRIVDVLDKANAIRQKCGDAANESSRLTLALFAEMFGKGTFADYVPQTLESVAAIASGVTKGRRFNGTPTVIVPYLRVANVQAGFLDLRELKTIEALPAEVGALALERGDIVMTEGGDHDKLGRGAIWDADIANCIHQNHIFRVRLDRSRLLPDFFATYLQTELAKRYFLRAAKKTTNLATINMRQLKALPVPGPPIAMQRRFETIAGRIRELVERQSLRRGAADELFESLAQRAFCGEL